MEKKQSQPQGQSQELSKAEAIRKVKSAKTCEEFKRIWTEYADSKRPQHEADDEVNILREPVAKYGIDADDDYPQPALTQEEIDNALTTDEFAELCVAYLDILFGKCK